MASTQLNYQKVERKQFAQSVRKITTENKYWNTFRPSYSDKLHSNIPFIRFSSLDPYDCVVCSNYDVRIFNTSTFEYKKLNFKNKPLVADMRSDRNLLAVGGKNGLFRIYNSANNSINVVAIRALNGHYNDINELKFDPLNSTKIISFSSDKSINYWDIINSKQILSIKNGHTDFIKTGDWCNNNSNLIISGSYDHFCKLWDLRTETNSENTNKSVSIFNHNLPIESVLSIPNSDLIAIGGGSNISIWSLRKSNKPLTIISKIHRKTITSLCINKLGTRLISGCLDNYIRIFKINNNESSYENVHSFITKSSILSVDISNNDRIIGIGTLNNGVNIRKRDEIMQDKSKDSQMEIDNINYDTKDWFIRGQKMKNIGNVQQYKHKKFKLKKYDIALAQFRYNDALNFALLTNDTLTVYNVFEDLWRRNGLEIALGGRDKNELIPILEYLIYSLPHPHLTQLSLHISAVIIDNYINIIGLDNQIDGLFKMIYKIINNVIKKYKILIKLQGNIQMILSAQDIIANPLSQKLIDLATKINQKINDKVDSLNSK